MVMSDLASVDALLGGDYLLNVIYEHLMAVDLVFGPLVPWSGVLVFFPHPIQPHWVVLKMMISRERLHGQPGGMRRCWRRRSHW